MSKLVDERVVEMRFDNSNFERNTRQSLSTIQKLKSSLNFGGVAESVNKSVRSITMAPIEAGLEQSSKAFTAWEIASITAISNITNRVVDLGLEIANSLFIEPEKTGWQKFAQETKDVGTLISTLKRDMSEEDATKQAYEYMEKIQWYANATSYNSENILSFITTMVGKGKDLKDAFTAATGIAQLAASAGISASDAIPIFNALSKVSDYVQLRQWESIRLARADTKDFQEQLLKAAANAGKLTANMETLDGSVQYMTEKGTKVSLDNFAETLHEDWLSTDILIDTLGKMGYAVNEVFDLNKKLSDEAGSEVSPYAALDEYINRMDQAKKDAETLGDEDAKARAELALYSADLLDQASEARTFQDAVEAVQKNVTNSWKEMFTKMIGEYSEATVFWSDFSDSLYDIFMQPVNAMNNFINSDATKEFRKFLFTKPENDGEFTGAIFNAFKAIEKIIDVIKAAWKEVFNFNANILDISKRIHEFSLRLIISEETAIKLQSVFRGLFSVLKLGIKILKGLKLALAPIFKVLKEDAGGILNILAKIGNKFANFVDTTTIFSSVGKKIGDGIQSIIDKLKELKIIENITKKVREFIEEVKMNEAIQDAWKSIKQTFATLFDILISGAKGVATFFGKYFVPILLNITKYFSILLGLIAGAAVKGIQFLVNAFKEFVQYLKSNETIQNRWKSFIAYLGTIPDRLKKLGPFFQKLGNAILNFFKALWNGIVKLGSAIANVLKLKTIGEAFAIIGDKIAYGFSKIVDAIKSLGDSNIGETTSKVKKKLAPLESFFKGLIDLFKGLWEVLKATITLIGRLMSYLGAMFTRLAKNLDSTFNKDIGSEGKGLSFWKLLNGGVVLLIGKTLYDFVFLFNHVTSALSDMMYAVAFNIRAKAVREWAESVKTIALSLLILVGAILLITMIDESALKRGLATIISLMTVMAGLIALMAKFAQTSYMGTTKLSIGKSGLSLNGTSSRNGPMGLAAMILSFGLAMLALTASLKIIDSINSEKLMKDLGVLALLMLALATAVGIMNAIANIGDKGTSGIKGIKGVLGFAIALLILMKPLKQMSEMDPDKLRQGILGISAVLLAFGATIRIMRGYKAKGLKSMAVFAASVSAIVVPIQMLGNLPIETLLKGVSVVSILGLLFGSMALLSSDFKIGNAIAIIALMGMFTLMVNAISMLINGELSNFSASGLAVYSGIVISIMALIAVISYSIYKLGSLKSKTDKQKKNIFKALSAFLAILGAVTITMYALVGIGYLSKKVDWVSLSIVFGGLIAILGISAAMMKYSKTLLRGNSSFVLALKRLILIAAIAGGLITAMASLALVAKMMSSVNWQGLLVTFGMLAIVIGSTIGILAFAKTMKVDKNTVKNVLFIGSVISALGIMMLGLSALVSVAKTADVKTIGKVLLLLGGTLLAAILTVIAASKFTTQITKVSKSLLQLGLAFAVFGAAAVLFGAGLQLLSNQLQGLIIFVGVAAALAIAMKLLGSSTPSMLTFAMACGLMGAAVLAIGLAFYLVTEALGKLLPNLDALSEKGEQVTTVISSITRGVVEGIAKALPVLIENIISGIDLIWQYLQGKLKEFVDWFMNLDLKDVAQFVAKLNALLFTVIIGALQALRDNIKEIVELLIDIANQIIYGVIDKLPDIMQALVDLVCGFIDALGQTIENNAAKIRDTMIGFCQHLWNAFLNFFGIHSPSKRTEDAGQNIILGIVQGIGKQLHNVIKAIVDVGKKMLREITKLPKEFLRAGGDILKAFWNGLKSVVSGVINFVKSIINGIKKIFGIGEQKTDYREAGKEAMVSYKDGMEKGEMDANKTAKAVISETVEELSKTDIFEEIGKNIVEYISYGISDNSYLLASSLTDLISQITQEIEQEYYALEDNSILSGYIKKLEDLIKNGISDEDLVIRPVVDTQQAMAQIDEIAKKLSGLDGVAITSNNENAQRASAEISTTRQLREARKSATTSDKLTPSNGDTYNVTFNITGNDPEAIAAEVDKKIGQITSRRGKAWA